MRSVRSNPLRRRNIDRRYRAEIRSGALWGYDPGPRSRHFDALGSIVDQHWDSVIEGRAGAGLALITSLRSISTELATTPTHRAAGDEAERLAALLASPYRTIAADIEHLLVDGRCLQHPDFAQRGIGRLTRSIIHSLAQAAPSLRLTVVTDSTLPHLDPDSLPPSIFIVDEPSIDDLLEGDAPVALLDPAPMTHPLGPLDRLDALRFAVIHDFVPLHAPDRYLPTSTDQLTYLIRLARLRHLDHYWCNSGAIAAETAQLLGRDRSCITVLPPPEPIGRDHPTPPPTVVEPFFFAPVGADRRKNLPCAVSILAHRSARGWPGNLVILSHMPDPHRSELNDLAAASGFDSDRIIVVSDLTDDEITWLFEHADVAVIPSFDEGLSLPLLESIDAGCPVVASDIPPHRELLGNKELLCDPRRPSAFADQIDLVLGDRATTLRRQQAAIARARGRHSFTDIVDSLDSN